MTEARLEIARALIEQEEKKIRALCVRLGVNPDLPASQLWAEIGRKLAREQPEFKPKRSVGRPPKTKSSSELLSEFVDMIQADVPNETAKEILKLAKEMRPKSPLFFPELPTLQKNVSRGRAIRGLTKNSRRF